MDGTLVDTEPYWIESEYELVEEHGGTWSARARDEPGRQRPARVRALHPRARGHRPRPAGRSSRSCSTGWSRGSSATVPWRPGAVELLADLRDRGVRCALVTMSYRRFVAPILAALPDGHLRGRRHRRRRRARASRTPSPTCKAAAAPRRRSRATPGDRGLQHRRPLRRGGRLHGPGRPEPRAGARPATGGSSCDTLAGLTATTCRLPGTVVRLG